MTGSAIPTILAVEDEPRNAALLKAILGGYDLHVAGDMASARQWLTSAAPDLVLLDRRLPDGDGLDLVAEIHAAAHLSATRIVLVTASVLDQDKAAALAAGCDGFVPKPIRIKPLLDEIEWQLGRSPRPE
jgi:CheY-like chemotaxis protein